MATRRFGIIGLFLLLAAALPLSGAKAQEAYLRIVDVGNGLCVVAREPGGRSLVYDAGYSGDHCPDAVDEIVGTAPVDMLVLSHSDLDHISDAEEILDRRGALLILHPGDNRSGTALDKLRTRIGLLEQDGTGVINVAADPPAPGASFALGAATVRFVAGWGDGKMTKAAGDPALSQSDSRNALSIVVRLEYGGKSVLLTGDTIGRRRGESNTACRNAERIMAEGSVPIDSDVLIGQHHGGDNSTSNCFIRAVSPTWVVFSAGRSHGHPQQSVADRLIANGVDPDNILRTDRGDNEGHGEWIYGALAGCVDKAGDDDVELWIPADPAAPIRIAYRKAASGC